MNWLYPFTGFEWGIILVFVAGYVWYFLRMLRLARRLNTTPWSIVPKFVLRSLTFTMLILAVLGPLFGETSRAVSTQGRDVFLLLDVSRSMEATDIAPTRLERAKYILEQLTDSLQTDRFGLILVADEAFVLSPLTTDHAALHQLLRAVRANTAGGGTNLCAAIDLARQKMLTDSSTRQRTRAIVLLSDGENFGSCPPTTLTQLRSYDINFMAVGVATDAGSPLRNGRAFLTDEQGQVAHSRLNRDFLRSLTQPIQGWYSDISDDLADDLMLNLRTLPGRTIDQRRIAVSTNKYYYFLGAALLLILLDILITVRTFRL
jgi:Ca-activated chloride channel homolog